MSRFGSLILGAALIALMSTPALALSPTPSAGPVASPSVDPAPTVSNGPPAAWPTGDQMRRELQQIGFAFRVDRDTGDWSGWAPRASVVESAALRLDGAGRQPAAVTFGFALLGGDPLGGDIDAALTAMMEVAARLPLDPADVESARRFIVDDLLAEPPELLESCYVSDWDRGAALVAVDTESADARLYLGSEAGAHGAGVDIHPEACVPLVPAEVVALAEDPSTERLTVRIAPGESAVFEPAEVTIEGALVTLVLTFRNDSTSEQALTFDQPLDATTGSVAPGGVKLIVVRQLPPGEYPFHGESEADAPRGLIRIVPRNPDP